MPPSYKVGVLTEMISGEVARRGRGAQTRLAEAAGVTVQTVNKWVQGQTHPESERWPSIEAHFGWDDGEIARRVLPALDGDSTLDIVIKLTDEVQRLVERMDRLEQTSPRSGRSGR